MAPKVYDNLCLNERERTFSDKRFHCVDGKKFVEVTILKDLSYVKFFILAVCTIFGIAS